MTYEFVDRGEELDFLEEKFESDSFEMILVYGRRRVGKTELMKHAVRNRESIYHLVVEEEPSKQLESLVETVSGSLDGFKPEVSEWEEFFDYFSSEFEDTVLIIDEFPRLVENDGSIPSRFQKFVDEYLEDTGNKLVLTGSSIGMMEELMSYENPLHGRRTGQIDLHPFDFENARKLLPCDIEEQVKFFSVFGGTPFYLQNVDKGKSLDQNIRDEICNQNSVLNQEPRMLIKQEFRSPGRYLSILESIASGKTRPKTISDDTDIPIQSISKYLDHLKSIRLIENRKPVTERSKRSRNGVYRLKDNFFDFWFRHIYPHMSDAVENPERFVENNLSDLERFYGRKFEQICSETISKTTEYGKVGSWWYKEDEIDVVGLNEREEKILFGEAKWRNQRTGLETFKDLRDTAERVRWKTASREEEFALFSKKGFTEELEEKAEKKQNIALYSLDKIDKKLQDK